MKFRSFRWARQSLIACTLIAAIVVFSCCIHFNGKPVPPATVAATGYVGDATCTRCHASIAASHKLTAHWRTSLAPSDSSIKGSFAAGHNRFPYGDSVYIEMEKNGPDFYQTLYDSGEQVVRKSFGIVVGSGTKGQTYLYWDDSNHLFQLPISYFTPAHTWSNSPGYPGIPMFTRPATIRCLECHATFAVQTSPVELRGPASFDPDQLMLGIGCERCHGPAGEHVAFQTAHPADTVSHGLARLAGFSRQQQLDLCRFCHGGNMPKTQPSFTYMPGDPLAAFFKVDSTSGTGPNIDVHGNQYGLLAASKCFRFSEMTCNTCHNTHRTERDNVALFSSRCQTCHQSGHNNTCLLTGKVDAATMVNCVECHMPRRSSKAITMYLPGQLSTTAALMRTHLIAVYPKETDQVLAAQSHGKPVTLHRVFDLRSGKWKYH